MRIIKNYLGTVCRGVVLFGMGEPPMRDKTYLIRFKRSDLIPHLVLASSAEIYGDILSSSMHTEALLHWPSWTL
jgi:hypothetical protein